MSWVMLLILKSLTPRMRNRCTRGRSLATFGSTTRRLIPPGIPNSRSLLGRKPCYFLRRPTDRREVELEGAYDSFLKSVGLVLVTRFAESGAEGSAATSPE